MTFRHSGTGDSLSGHMHRQALFRLVSALFLLFQTTLASASLEQVTPLSGGIEYYEQYYPQQTLRTDPDMACSAYARILNDTAKSNGDSVVILSLLDAGIYSGNLHYYRCNLEWFHAATGETSRFDRNILPWIPPRPAVCPSATPPYQYNPSSDMCERQAPCPPPAILDAATGECVECLVAPLSKLPSDDLCAHVLENIHSTQAQKDAACGTLSQALNDGKSCLENKLSGLMDPSTHNPIFLKITSDIRSNAYQAHLKEVWKKMEELIDLENDPVMKAACSIRRAEIAAEKGCDIAGPCVSCYAESDTQRSHCLKGMPANPSPNDAQHTQGNAFDVSMTRTIQPLQAALEAGKPPQSIQQFLDGPPSCNLNWGGIFTNNYDPVHFYAR